MSKFYFVEIYTYYYFFGKKRKNIETGILEVLPEYAVYSTRDNLQMFTGYNPSKLAKRDIYNYLGNKKYVQLTRLK